MINQSLLVKGITQQVSTSIIYEFEFTIFTYQSRDKYYFVAHKSNIISQIARVIWILLFK